MFHRSAQKFWGKEWRQLLRKIDTRLQSPFTSFFPPSSSTLPHINGISTYCLKRNLIKSRPVSFEKHRFRCDTLIHSWDTISGHFITLINYEWILSGTSSFTVNHRHSHLVFHPFWRITPLTSLSKRARAVSVIRTAETAGRSGIKFTASSTISPSPRNEATSPSTMGAAIQIPSKRSPWAYIRRHSRRVTNFLQNVGDFGASVNLWRMIWRFDI